MARVLLLVGILSCASAMQVKVTPVQKVIEMLTGMKVKGEAMMDSEAKIFAKYEEWVDDQTKQLNFEIETGEKEIEELGAFIAKADDDVSRLGREIGELDDDIARFESELKDATSMRKEENEEYLKISSDYAESVDALERAIQTLGSQNVGHAQAEALLQQMSATVPGMPSILAAFVQQKAVANQDGAPAVAAYEFQSSGIVEMLEGLLDKFKGELDDVNTEETNKAHNFDLTKLHLSDLIEQSNLDRERKAASKGKTAAKSAKAKGQLVATKEELASDQKLLADMTAAFKAKSETYEENQKVRKAELEAISKAIEIVSSPSVADSYANRVNLAQVSSTEATSLLQTQSSRARVVARQMASSYLQRRAKALSSKTLAAFAAEIAANPFVKVVEMIEGLLAKLKEEAAAEADHKQWCDEQLKNNKLKRNKKTTQSDELNAQIEELTSTIASQGKEIGTLLAEQAELTKAMGEATGERTEEKAENEAIIADAQAGSQAVTQALEVLREFYQSQSFLQQAPEIEEYKGMASGGIIGMLEVIASDFARLEAETKSSEAQAAMQYEAFMTESKANQERKHKKEVRLKLDKDQNDFDKSEAKKDLVAVTDELGKANAYYEELKPTCVEIKVSFEERAAKRKAEIESLNQAYDILDSKSG